MGSFLRQFLLLRCITGALGMPPRKRISGGRVPPAPDTFPAGAYDPRPFFRYELLHQSTKSRARVGRLHTPHGIVDTPGFVAVATNGALKALDIKDADAAGQQLIFANSYHLMVRVCFVG